MHAHPKISPQHAATKVVPEVEVTVASLGAVMRSLDSADRAALNKILGKSPDLGISECNLGSPNELNTQRYLKEVLDKIVNASAQESGLSMSKRGLGALNFFADYMHKYSRCFSDPAELIPATAFVHYLLKEPDTKNNFGSYDMVAVLDKNNQIIGGSSGFNLKDVKFSDNRHYDVAWQVFTWVSPESRDLGIGGKIAKEFSKIQGGDVTIIEVDNPSYFPGDRNAVRRLDFWSRQDFNLVAYNDQNVIRAAPYLQLSGGDGAEAAATEKLVLMLREERLKAEPINKLDYLAIHAAMLRALDPTLPQDKGFKPVLDELSRMPLNLKFINPTSEESKQALSSRAQTNDGWKAA